MPALVEPPAPDETIVRGSPEQIAAILPVIAAMRAQSHYPFRLDELAEMACLSRFHFSRVFADVAGIPPGEFMTALRFERAKELLLTTSLSVTDVCFETGWGSLGTFSARFTKLVGVSPVQFRQLPFLLSDRPEPVDVPPTIVPAGMHSIATLTGTMFGLDPTFGAMYLGLFPAAIARNHPVTGMLITRPGPYRLEHLPYGHHVLLAVAFPRHQTLIDHLQPGEQMRVGMGEQPVLVRRGDEQIISDLHFRPPHPADPPILVSLPALRR